MSDFTQGSNVTIKFSGGPTAPWYTVHGTPAEIKAQIVEYFELEDVDGLSTHAVVLRAAQIAQSTETVREVLGGEVINESKPTKSTSTKPWSKKGSGKPQEPAGSKESEHPYGEVLVQIEGAESAEDLTRIYVLNEKAFEHPDVLAASVAKNESLTKENSK